MDTKTAYQFDTAGLFLGEVEADKSPLEVDVYLLPARCTFVAPPDVVPDDKWPRWNGSAWGLVARRDNGQQSQDDAVLKLRDFLSNNPDVAALLG